MFGCTSGIIVTHLVILLFLLRTPVKSYITELYEEPDDHENFIENDIDFTKQPTRNGRNNHGTTDLGDMYLNGIATVVHDDLLGQALPLSVGILKALEYINAHPDPGTHDESRRVKRT